MWTTDDTRRHLAAGRTVCPVGQLSPAAARWLRAEARAGRVAIEASDWPDRRPQFFDRAARLAASRPARPAQAGAASLPLFAAAA